MTIMEQRAPVTDLALPPDVQREAFDGMLTVLRGMGTTMTSRGDQLPPALAYAIAIMACRLGLDPSLGHVLILGNKPYVTVAGLLYHANTQVSFDGLITRPASENERLDFYSPSEPPNDEHLWRCEVHLKNREHPMVAWGRSMVATHRIGERASSQNRFSPAQSWSVEMAEARAIGRALRRAFSLAGPTYEEMSDRSDSDAIDVTPPAEDEASSAPPTPKPRKKRKEVVKAEPAKKDGKDSGDAVAKIRAASKQLSNEVEKEKSDRREDEAAAGAEVDWAEFE